MVCLHTAIRWPKAIVPIVGLESPLVILAAFGLRQDVIQVGIGRVVLSALPAFLNLMPLEEGFCRCLFLLAYLEDEEVDPFVGQNAQHLDSQASLTTHAVLTTCRVWCRWTRISHRHIRRASGGIDNQGVWQYSSDATGSWSINKGGPIDRSRLHQPANAPSNMRPLVLLAALGRVASAAPDPREQALLKHHDMAFCNEHQVVDGPSLFESRIRGL